MPPHTDPPEQPHAFLAGGGEMGRLIRSMDWSSTPLGPVESWPQSLRTTISLCLASNFPIDIVWGPKYVQIYNDGYWPICGGKHPRSMGQNFTECWASAWPVIGEAFAQALAGQPSFLEDQRIFVDRNGYLEETFFTFSFSPIRDETGGVGGLFHPVTETTAKMLSDRRTRALRDLAARTSKAKSVSEALALSAQALAEYDLDLPFVLLYALDPNCDQAWLVGTTGLKADTPASPSTVDLGAQAQTIWPLEEVVRLGSAVQVDDVAQRVGPAPIGPYPESPTAAFALPIIPPGANRPVAVVIAGVSSRLPMNEAYRSFYDLLASGVTTAVANARVFEEERRRAEALAELDRAKIAFFSNVSHEFRTPLTLMLGPVEDMLSRSHSELSPAAKGQLEIVNRNGMRLLRLVNTLLDFSRIEAGRVRAVYQPTDLAAFTADLASVFRSACERAGLRLVVDCPKLAGPVYVDRDMWEKVVLNLLSNAFKFTLEGEIAVTLRQGEPGVSAPGVRTAELQIRDTGTGVPAAEMPRLFERFHRVENAGGRTHEGSGIGLALVQELVELHGGIVTAASVEGEGTTFTITVPMGSAHLPSDQIGEVRGLTSAGGGSSPYVEEALGWLPDGPGVRSQESGVRGHEAGFRSQESGVSGQESGIIQDVALPSLPPNSCLLTPNLTPDARPLVLLADDNADMRRYVARLLADRYQIEAVPDGEAALAATKQRIPDLVLTDVMMPRLDGFGLLRELRADPRSASVPVIMLSARAGEESRIEGMEAGADDYLVKPFGARELLARVSAHLQMARMRREASETIRASEGRTRTILESITDGFFALDHDWRFTYLNAAGERFLDRAPGDLIGKRLWEEFPGTVGSEFELVYRRVITTRVGESFTAYYPNFERWYEVSAYPAPEGLTVYFRDVTDRKQAEVALRESEARIRAFADAAPAMLWETDPAGDCTFLSREWYSFTGQTEVEALGLGWTEAIHPDDRAEAGRVFLAANTRRHEFQLEYRLRGNGSGYRWALDVGRPRFAASGEYLGMVGVVIDIDDRKRADGRLRQSEARLRQVFESNVVGMIRWDLDRSLILDANAEFLRMTGYAREDVTSGKLNFRDLTPAEWTARNEQGIHTIRADGHAAPYQKEYYRQDGSRVPLIIAGTRFEDSPSEGMSFLIDVSELKQVQQALLDADRRKDEFLATLAHELRNPLAPLRNGLQVMKLAKNNAEAIEQSRTMMERQLGQMIRLIDDLLDVSRISRGRIELKRERVDLTKVVQQAIENSRPLIEQANHELVVSVPSDPIYVDADVTRLAQVYANLLNNAAKYTEAGGRIRLTIERQGSDAVVTVRDNGVGIAAHMLPKVFELFTQVDRSLEKSQGGLGIGLSLVKGLVEMHGGSVEARSEGPGMGSEFIVRVPVVLSLVGEPRNNEDGDAIESSDRRRILVVDDNRDSAISLAMMLKYMGNELRTAHDGLEALDVAAAFRPDVILLDIGMPRLNGYDTARRIREQPWGKNTLLVALTGWGQEEDRQKSQAAGFDIHLVKPVDLPSLEKLLANSQSNSA